jgi:large subunit ribosomal protein L25
MEHIPVEARPRTADATKGERNRLRREGHIPAAVFGKGMEPVLVTVEARELARVLRSGAGANTLIDLSLGDQRHLVKLTEVEMDPIARTFLHVGLHKIVGNEPAKATVPVELVGEPEDVRSNMAILEPGSLSVDIKCPPESMVSAIALDVSDMKVGDVKHASDLDLPAGFELLSAPDTAIVSVHVARAMVEEVQQTIDAASAEASPASGDAS